MAEDIALDGGLDEILNRLAGRVPNTTLYIAVGSSNAAPVGTETGLGMPVARAIVATGTVGNRQAVLRAFFNTSQANGNIGESGLVTAESGGVLIDRGVQVPLQCKTATQEMIVEKIITLERG